MRRFTKFIATFLLIISVNGIFGQATTNTKLNIDNKSNKYEPLEVNWSRTKEPGKGVSSIDTIGKNQNERKYWETSGLTKILNKYPQDVLNDGPRVIEIYRALNGGSINKRVILDYETIMTLLEPKETENVWDGAGPNRYYSGYINNTNGYPVKEFATWKHYENGKGDIKKESLRLFRGEFELPDDMTGKKVYVGILNDDSPDLILPINDTMMVLVNGKPTNMNFTTQATNNTTDQAVKIRTKDENGENVDNPIKFKQAVQSCNKGHETITRHTDGWHSHVNEKEGVRELGDITPYLNKNLGKQKIELLVGDISGGGGTTKLDIFIVDEANMEVTKGGYLLNGDKEVTIKDSEQSLYPGENVNYTFSLKNTGKEDLTNISFKDELIDLKINKNGLFRLSDNNEIADISELEISKSDKNNTISTKKGREALELLQVLKPGEQVTVKDKKNIKYEIKASDTNEGILRNTVTGIANYFNETLTLEKDATFSVIPVTTKPKVAIAKSTESIIRDNKEIYNATSGPNIPEVMPMDRVKFNIDITNKTIGNKRKDNEAVPLVDVKLTDSFIDDYSGTNPKGGWIFKAYEVNDDGSRGNEIKGFDANKFNLKANEKIRVTAEQWIVPEPKKDWSYTATNEVYLSQYNKEIGKASTSLTIKKPNLYIKKELIESVNEDESKTFSINVKGNDGSNFNIEAKPNVEYKLNNLKYGVEYTVSEIVPANYELSNIQVINKDTNSVISEGNKITLTSNNIGSCIKVQNRLANNKYFFDEYERTNIFNPKVVNN